MPALPLLLGALLFATPAELVLVTKKQGVTVLKRDGAKVVDLVALGEFAAPPERVRAVLLDYPHHPSYIAHVAESTVLAREPALLVYERLALPMIDDRDYTIRIEWGADGPSLWMRFATANDRGPPPRKGIVRVALHEGEWRLDPIDGGRRTFARYSVRLDLGGSVPRLLCRSGASDDLPHLFESIRSQLR